MSVRTDVAAPPAPPTAAVPLLTAAVLRVADLVLGGAALVVSAPLMAAIALAVALTSRGPVLYRAARVGRNGQPFDLLKFRTMRVGAAASGPGVTTHHDPRVTGPGRWLRRAKLDELPQLFNVVAGQMSLVGPRPEDPRYVVAYDARQRSLLALRPGVTSPASLVYRDEAALLGGDDPERVYVATLLPAKLAIDLDAFAHHGLRSYFSCLVRTVGVVAHLPGVAVPEPPLLAVPSPQSNR